MEFHPPVEIPHSDGLIITGRDDDLSVAGNNDVVDVHSVLEKRG
jgi:hypothetical protein